MGGEVRWRRLMNRQGVNLDVPLVPLSKVTRKKEDPSPKGEGVYETSQVYYTGKSVGG